MRSAAAFQAEGFTVLQSDSYLDPDTSETREIDVIAYKGVILESFSLHINYVIECKNSPDKPWVMFMGNEMMLGSSIHLHRMANGLGKALFGYFASKRETRDLLPKISNLRAYGMTEAFGNEGASASHKAVISATKAALANAKATSGANNGLNMCEIFLPLIVLEGKLAQASLDKVTSEPHFVLTDQGSLIQRSPTGLQIVDVVTASELVSYAQRASEQCDEIFAAASDHHENILKRLRKHPDYSSEMD